MAAKFKIGDRVLVTRASTEDEYYLWNNSWIVDMNRTIGKICTICQVSNIYKGIYTYRFEEYSFSFPEFVLRRPIKSKQLYLWEITKIE